MREILFRGKRMNGEAWVEGSLICFADGCAFICVQSNNDDELDKYEVIPETVGQYTGLTANGKKIFEGDIVDCWSEGVNAQGTVQQRRDGLWIIYPAWQKRIMWSLCPDEYSNTTVEVIGNIHDNPELLKGSESDAREIETNIRKVFQKSLSLLQRSNGCNIFGYEP